MKRYGTAHDYLTHLTNLKIKAAAIRLLSQGMTTPPQAAGYQKTSQATILYAPRGGELTPQRLE